MIERLKLMRKTREKELVTYVKHSAQWIECYGQIKYIQGRLDQLIIFGGNNDN